MIVDRKLLPANALVDTGVFIRFLGERNDARTEACKGFCEAMLNEGRNLYVAAPTLAEVMRHKGKPIPHQKGIVVVAFDQVAAELLALQMPMAKLQEAKTLVGTSLTYLKYDAMIVACALRAKTAAIVSLDGDFPKLAPTTIPLKRPEDFAAAQQTLTGILNKPVGS